MGSHLNPQKGSGTMGKKAVIGELECTVPWSWGDSWVFMVSEWGMFSSPERLMAPQTMDSEKTCHSEKTFP